jgi:hypothetical protein
MVSPSHQQAHVVALKQIVIHRSHALKRNRSVAANLFASPRL